MHFSKLNTIIYVFTFLTLICMFPIASGHAYDKSHSESIFFNIYKLFNRANLSSYSIIDQLYRDVKYTIVNSNDRTDVNSLQKCSDGLDELFNGLLNEEMWAFSMLDAGSKIPSGLLAGNLVDLGAYDQCLDISVKDGTTHFAGQHCMFSLRVIFNQSPFSGVEQIILGDGITYTFSLCLPSSCSPETLSNSTTTIIKYINPLLRMLSNESIQLAAGLGMCHTKNSRPSWTTAEILGAFVTILCVLPAVICTILDLTLCRRSRPRVSEPVRKYVTAISMAQNLEKLLDTRQSDDAIKVLHMLKFLGIAWVVIGHRFKLSAAAPLINFLKILDYLKEWNTMLILSAPLSVDIFFTISGILNVYSYFTIASRKELSFGNHLFSYAHRYIRLTPAYALMILVTATWMYRLGDGPLWDNVVGEAKQGCVDHWWTNLLYINNYLDPINNCLLQSWYLAADMQMFWVSPLVVYTLWRWPKLGLTTLVLLACLSILSPFLVAYYYQIRTPIPLTMDPQREALELTVLYLPTHTKTISYVIGMMGGYVLHLVKTGQVPKKINIVLNLIIWITVDILMTVALYGGHYLYLLDTPYNIWESSLYIALYRLLWSSSITWVIIACTTGNAGIIAKVFCYKAWVPLGRLTYCIYLTHAAVILYSIGSLREPQYLSFYTMILNFGGEFLISIALAVVLTLTIESPILGLERVLGIRPGREKRPSKRNSSHDPNQEQNNVLNLPNVLNRETN